MTVAWDNATAALDKRPIYYIAIDGLTSKRYSTGTVEEVYKALTNFGTSGTPEVAGYRLEDIDTYSAARGYGWLVITGLDSRLRSSAPSEVKRSFNFIDNTSQQTWQLDIPNGTYDYRIICGDEDNPQGPHVIDVNGVEVINESTTAGNYVEYEGQVVVSAGKIEVVVGEAGASGSHSLINEFAILRKVPEYRPLLTTPDGSMQLVDRLQGKTTVGAIRFTLLDEDNEITDIVATEKAEAGATPTFATLVNRKVVLWGGYANIAQADYATIFTGRISAVRMTREGGSYEFEISDLKRAFQEPIMKNASDTAQSIVEGNIVNVLYAVLADDFSLSGNFPLDSFSGSPTGLGIATALIDTTDLAAVRDLWFPQFKVRYQFANSEMARGFIETQILRLIGYAIIFTDGSISIRASNPPLVTEATPPTLDEDDIIGQPQWMKRFDLHFNRFVVKGDHNARNISISVGQKGNEKLTGTASSGQKVIPIGSTDDFVVGNRYLIRDATGSPEEEVVLASKIENTSVTAVDNLSNSYATDDLLLGIGVRSGGTRIFLDNTDGLEVNHVYTLENQDRDATEQVRVSTVGSGSYIDVVVAVSNRWVQGDRLFTELFPTQLALVEDTADQTATGETVEVLIESQGLRTHMDGAALASNVVTRFKRRYLKPPVEIKVRTLFTKRGIEVGEVILVTHSRIPNLLSGTMGVINQPYEVIRVQPDFRSGTMGLTLLAASPGARYFIIAPNTTPTYLSASDEEKQRLGFICDEADDKMSNDDPPYLIV